MWKISRKIYEKKTVIFYCLFTAATNRILDGGYGRRISLHIERFVICTFAQYCSLGMTKSKGMRETTQLPQ